MEKPPYSFDWNQTRAFLATVDAGSLSGAARALGLTQPTVGRQISALEADLGLLLFERGGRTLALTRAGLDLVEHARAMEVAANRVALAASGQSQAVEGLVRITASDIFSAYLMPRALKRIEAAAPHLEIDLVASNEVRDLIRREADIAVRHVRPEQPDLIAKKVRTSTARFYAAPGYLARHGTPGTLEALSQHRFISFTDTDQMIGYMKGIGLELTRGNFRYGSASGIVAWELVRQGFGVTIMSEDVGAMTPEVVPVLPEMDPVTFPTWLVTHRELHTSRRIRLVFDLLSDFLEQARRV
ncbi:LysR family transcriptional regulator [uncultured Roseobacter sp.]|uniref:LysR family transcriptional regulator n=1 Tax=uncultured Roseobacter sp. TaxID=114847 RepID=UPI00261B3791|nr:LysR family transcriptional regulator [uncultured Roseobacter sp.]